MNTHIECECGSTAVSVTEQREKARRIVRCSDCGRRTLYRYGYQWPAERRSVRLHADPPGCEVAQ